MFKKVVIEHHVQTVPMDVVNQAREFLSPKEVIATIRVSRLWRDSVTDVRIRKLSFNRQNKKDDLKMLTLFHNSIEELSLTQNAPCHASVLKVEFPNLIRLRLNFSEHPKVSMEKMAVHLLNQISLRDVTLDIENINWLSFTKEVPWNSLRIDGGKLPILNDKLPHLRKLDVSTDDTTSTIDFERYPQLQTLTLYYQEVVFLHAEECKLDEMWIASVDRDAIPDVSQLPVIPVVKVLTFLDHDMLNMWKPIITNKKFKEVQITHDDADPDIPFSLTRTEDAIIFSIGPAEDFPKEQLADLCKQELAPWLSDVGKALKLPILMSRHDMTFRQRLQILGYFLEVDIFTDLELELLLNSATARTQLALRSPVL